MNRQGHLNNTQHGFRSGRSCLSALLDVFDDLMHMLSSDTTVDMIYLQTTQPTSGGAVTVDSSCCANCVEPPRPNGGTIYRFLGMPAMRTRWMAGAAAHKSG